MSSFLLPLENKWKEKTVVVFSQPNISNLEKKIFSEAVHASFKQSALFNKKVMGVYVFASSLSNLFFPAVS